MTQQFEFGDRVLTARGETYIVIKPLPSQSAFPSCIVMNEGGDTCILPDKCLTPVSHPDTVRLDWLAAQDDIDITLGNTVQLKPCLRAHIDAAMQEQAAEEDAQ